MVKERVTLRFRGLMLEKFLSKALEDGVLFERVQRVSRREARLLTDEAGAKSLLQLAKRFSLDVKMTNRRGAGAIYIKLKRRFTYPIALCLVFSLGFWFLHRLWVIELLPVGTGAAASAIETALFEQGIRAGMNISKVDPQALRARLLSALPDYAFVGVSKRGVCLKISAARALHPPDIYNPEDSRDLVAARDALVLTVDALSGTPLVKPGDVVLRGQTLILGQERDTREGGTRGVCALGAVVGRVWSSGVAEAALLEVEEAPTGRERVSAALSCLSWTLTLREAEPFERERVLIENVEIGGTLLPLRLTRTRHIETNLRTISRNEGQTKNEISGIALMDAQLSAPEGILPVDKWTDYSMIEGDRIRARAVLEFHVNVAVARETR